MESHKIKAVIIDDEADARENLQALLGKYCPDVEVAGQAASAVKGLEIIEASRPDLVFLDVQMPQGNGLDFLEKLQPVPFEVIFITAYDEYAIRAIRLSALDYLLKPVSILDLKAAVQKATAKITDKHAATPSGIRLPEKDPKEKRIGLSTSEGVIFVKVSEIVRCEADDTYTTFFISGGSKIMVSKTLKEYESQLTGCGFFRIHQSHLVNMAHIRKYVKGVRGQVIMSDDSMLGIARSKKDEFLKALDEWSR